MLPPAAVGTPFGPRIHALAIYHEDPASGVLRAAATGCFSISSG